MFIKEWFRWYGIGKKLVDEFKKYCKLNNIDNIKVTASYKNENAVNFYKNNWFDEFNVTLTMKN